MTPAADAYDCRRMSHIDRGGRPPLSHVRSVVAAHRLETAGFAAILVVAAFLRLEHIQSRAYWDSDQGQIMLAIWNVLHTGTIPQLGQPVSASAFHHGALYYDLMVPGAWLSGGLPMGVLLETALGGFVVVPMVWWVARSIGGAAAGLAAAVLAATSGGLVYFSARIWNPTLVEPGAALALLGAWQAWSSRRPVWLLAAAAGTAVAMQSEIAAGVLVLPMSGVLIALLCRGPAGQRRRIALWGAAGVALIVATYVPFIVYEVNHDFAESRAILAFVLGKDQPVVASSGPVNKIAVSGLRILAWPLTGWPNWGMNSSLGPAIGAAGALACGLAWRLVATWRPLGQQAHGPQAGSATSQAESATSQADGSGGPQPDAAGPSPSAGALRHRERDGTWLVVVCLGVMILALGLGMSNTSKIGPIFPEQIHIAADPFVIVGAGIVLGSLWRLQAHRNWARVAGRLLYVAALAASVSMSVGQWPGSPNPWNWHAAQAAAKRIEQRAAGKTIALVGMPGNKTADAYTFPLVVDGATLATPDSASILVILCDSTWNRSCGGHLEGKWLASQPYASAFHLLDRFTAAPGRTLSVYGRQSS